MSGQQTTRAFLEPRKRNEVPATSLKYPKRHRADQQSLLAAQTIVICDCLLLGSVCASRYLGAVLFIGHISIYSFTEFLLTLARFYSPTPRMEKIRTLLPVVSGQRWRSRPWLCVQPFSRSPSWGSIQDKGAFYAFQRKWGLGWWGGTQSLPYTETDAFCRHSRIWGGPRRPLFLQNVFPLHISPLGTCSFGPNGY